MEIVYKVNAPLTLNQFVDLYKVSTLAERRPAEDRRVMQQMMENASLTITAWDGDELVGISRTLTDFGYVAYLADLAVAHSHQGQKIGKALVDETRSALPADCLIVLLSAPAANGFYPKIGFEHHDRAWVIGGR